MHSNPNIRYSGVPAYMLYSNCKHGTRISTNIAMAHEGLVSLQLRLDQAYCFHVTKCMTLRVAEHLEQSWQ